jgi:integrase
MAWIYKRKQDGGTWWIGTRANGKQILKSTGTHNEQEARAKLATLEAMESAQRAGKLNRELFEALTGAHIEAVDLFSSLDTWLNETANPNTKRNYETFACQLKEAMPHNPVLSDITHEQVRAFLATIRAQKRPSTANLALACSKTFFGRFRGALQKNPTEGIPRYKDDGDKVDREAFTPEQIRSIVKVASPFWRCAAAVAFYTGLRLSDVARLKVGQVDFRSGKLNVARTVKTGAKVGVKLPSGLVAMLKEAVPAGAGPDDFIWPEEAATAQHVVSNLSRQFAKLLIKAGLRKELWRAGNGIGGRRNVNALTFHSLRHSFISALANAGVNQQTVKKLVGHASDTINDAYTHIGQDALDKAAGALPNIIEVDVK